MSDYLINQEGVDDIDVFIGQRLKMRRLALGLSQSKLGSYLGITFQQIQKYEKGTNRISAKTLYNLAILLGVDFSYFVEGFKYGKSKSLHEDVGTPYEFNEENKKETVDLLRAYYRIPQASVRKKFKELCKSISNSEN